MNISIVKNLALIIILSIISSICTFASMFIAYSALKFIVLTAGILFLTGGIIVFKNTINKY